MVVVALQTEGHATLGEELQQCHCLLEGEVARGVLRIVGVEDVGVCHDYAVTILLAMTGQEVAQPRRLETAERAICRVEREEEILALGVCDLKPIDRGAQVLAVIFPL